MVGYAVLGYLDEKQYLSTDLFLENLSMNIIPS